MFMRGTAKGTPLTHDLLAHILRALGTKVERVDCERSEAWHLFARLILSAENELATKEDYRDRRPAK